MNHVIARLAVACLVTPLLSLVGTAGSASAVDPTPCADLEVLAHRGVHTDVVGGIDENSIGAFDETVAGGWSIETDIRADADGKLWVFHDRNPNRATGVTGVFDEMTSREVGALRYKLGGSPLPSFNDLLDWLVANPGAQIYIEPKMKYLPREGQRNLNIPREILRRLTNLGLTDRSSITRFREALPADPGVGLLSKPRNLVPDPQTLADADFTGVTLWPGNMTAANVAAYHAVGIEVQAVKSLKRWHWRRAIRAGADAIVTDTPWLVKPDCNRVIGS